MGDHFRHNAHKAAIILVSCMLFIYLLMLLMLYFLILQLFWWVGWILGVILILVNIHITNCYVIYQIIIYTFYTNNLTLCFFSYLAYVDTRGLDYVSNTVCTVLIISPECYQNESIPNYFHLFLLYLTLNSNNLW